MNPCVKRSPGRPVSLVATTLVVLQVLLLPSCAREQPRATVQAVAPVAVKTVVVGGEAGNWIEVPGSVEAARAADIASRLSAVVESVHADEGTYVRAGDLLVRLGGGDMQARLDAAEAALQASTAQRDRIRALLAKDAATRQEKEATEAAWAAAAAERDAAKAQMEYVEIRAPFDGWVTRKTTRAGDLAVPGQPLVSIQGTGLLRVAATVTKSQADRLRPGQSIDVALEGAVIVPARLSVLSRAGDPSSLRFLVKADLPEDSGARVGSFARLRLPRAGEEPAPLVPRAAIVERGALTGVYVVEDGRARLRWISPGEAFGESMLIRSGLSIGEEVVLEPRAVSDGTPLTRRP
jgi:RND family efflux transporter MFP subunit